jgi:hypothetical protein
MRILDEEMPILFMLYSLLFSVQHIIRRHEEDVQCEQGNDRPGGTIK